jgi:DNA-binding CsgD family transcriptional regulator
MLQAAGLTQIEEQAYRLLVKLRSATPEYLRRRLGLSIEQADLAFGGLAAQGLVTITTTVPRRLVATPPDVAGEALLLNRLKDLQAARVEFVRLADEYRASTAGRPIDEMIEIAPAEALPTLVEQLQRQATSTVWMIVVPPYAVPADRNSIELEQLKSGVAYLALYTQAALEEPGAIDTIRPYVAAGEQARMLPDLGLKLGIFDRKVAMVPMDRGRAADTGDAVIVRESTLLDALIELFERLWLSAIPLTPLVSDAAPDNPPISADDARLLTLLLGGLTDDAIGRQLGLARRTVVRRAHHLMERAKAVNRLQLIWRATQLGWIQPPGNGLPSPRGGSSIADEG